MKQTIRLLGLILFLLSMNATAQNVIVTVQVLPPYSTYLPDYLNNPSKVVFTLLSPTTRDVKIKATITGDNGITIATSPSGSAATPIHLVANQVKMMNGTSLKAYLDVNTVTVAGINKNELYRGNGIPEGNYTVCLQVLDYVTGDPLSEPAPTGCSNPFQIMQINPPTLIAPKCDETIVAGNMPQNMVFTWLPAPGVAPGTQYKLKIVELVPITRNPNEAMNSATTPAFFETTVNTYSFFYGPAQPALKDGKKYAWRITAVKSGVVNSNFQNNGSSEVCSFLYQKPAVTAQLNTPSYGIKLIKPIQGAHINSGYGLEFSWTATQKAFKNYELQFTDSYRQGEKITNWTSLPENLFSTRNAFMASKDVGKKLAESLPGSWTNGKGKIAWRMIARDNNEKAIDSSKIETYEVVDAPLAERIKLVSPIQGKKIVSGYGLKFQWESSKKLSVTKYQLQFTNSISQSQTITNWSNIPEKLFSNKNAFFASKDTQELSVELPNMWTSGTGKIAWRVVGYSYGFAVDSSKIETYEIIEDTSEISKLKGFMIDGYYVQITQITNKDQDKFGGSGLMYLWEGGKQVKVYFNDLKVRPFSFIPKTQTKLWAAIQGEVNIDIYNQLYGQSKFNLATTESDGTFQLGLNKMKITANIEGTMEGEMFKITKDLSHAEGMVKGKWFTNFFIPTGNGTSNNLYEFESDETSIKMSFADKFDGAVNLKADKKVEGLANGKIAVEFGSLPGEMELKVKGLQGDLNLSGTVMVDKARPVKSSIVTTFSTLSLPFKNQKNLNFPLTLDKPLSWDLNKDGSVKANITEMYVHLSSTGALDNKFKNYPQGLNFDKFGAKIIMPSKSGNSGTMDINFSNIYNKGKGYGTLLKNEFDTKSEVNISGFTSHLTKTDLLMNNNTLIYLNIQGEIYVPFINDWSPVAINIDKDKIQEISVNIDYNKKYYLSKSDGEVYMILSSGRLESNAIVISPRIIISNSQRKGVETKSLQMCDIFIESTGAISFNNNFGDNTESVCEGSKYWATYFKFDYSIDKIKIKRNTIKTDAQFMFSGDIVLAPGITSTSRKEAGFLYHGPQPNPGTSATQSGNGNAAPGSYTVPKNTTVPKNITPKGPALDSNSYDDSTPIAENSLEITDDKVAVQGSYEDGGQKFGGGFKMVQNDPTWGDYFELGGYYEAKEPSCKEIDAKFILGKKNSLGGPFSYWFFEFHQKGYLSIPVIPGIAEIHGFGGKAYYHMGVNYDNQGNITSMVPDKKKSLGIAAIADFRTAYDQGITVHGKATIVTQFSGWSLDKIDYYVKGDAISANDSSSGLLQARINGSLNWADKYIDGKGQIWGNVKDLVCLNEGQANEDAVGFHFGADDFFIHVGTPEVPITAEILCGNGWSTGVWFGLDTNSIGVGFSNHYDSDWKGLNLGVAKAQGRLITDLSAGLDVTYSPFQATGKVSFSGRAYGRGCVKYIGCIGGSCGATAKLTVSLPDPVLFKGSVTCDVSRWIPDFTLNAEWSSTGGFSIYL